MDKELALAIDFKKAPKEVQDAATQQYTNEKNVLKLKQKLAETAKELEAAEQVAFESSKVLKKAMANWTPELA